MEAYGQKWAHEAPIGEQSKQKGQRRGVTRSATRLHLAKQLSGERKNVEKNPLVVCPA